MLNWKGKVAMKEREASKVARRRYSPEEKVRMLEEAQQPGSSLSSVARKYGVAPSQIYDWRKRMKQGQLVAVGSKERLVSEAEVKALKEQLRERERLLGKQAVQIEILKEAVRIGREKKLISPKALEGLDDFR